MGKVLAKAIAPDVSHIVLFWEGWDGASREVAVQSGTEEDKVGEAPSHAEIGFGEGFIVGLAEISVRAGLVEQREYVHVW